MDVTLTKTFLAVAATQSFVAAAERLFVTQSAVSLRIQKLESILGQQLFVRSKSGVTLTRAGERFARYARSMLQLWDETLYQVSLPGQFTGSLSLGCQDSLWPELSSQWLSKLSDGMGQIAFSFQISTAESLSNMLLRGTIDVALLYNPQMRQGFHIERILEDRLVLVSSRSNQPPRLDDHYVYAQWGEEFAIAHARWFPEMSPPQLSMQVGSSLPGFLIANDKMAYLPYRIADDYIAAGQLHFVKGAPSLSFPAFAVWTNSPPASLLADAMELLRIAAREAPWIELD